MKILNKSLNKTVMEDSEEDDEGESSDGEDQAIVEKNEEKIKEKPYKYEEEEEGVNNY